jgi:hypothetical protein
LRFRTINGNKVNLDKPGYTRSVGNPTASLSKNSKSHKLSIARLVKFSQNHAEKSALRHAKKQQQQLERQREKQLKEKRDEEAKQLKEGNIPDSLREEILQDEESKKPVMPINVTPQQRKKQDAEQKRDDLHEVRVINKIHGNTNETSTPEPDQTYSYPSDDYPQPEKETEERQLSSKQKFALLNAGVF